MASYAQLDIYSPRWLNIHKVALTAAVKAVIFYSYDYDSFSLIYIARDGSTYIISLPCPSFAPSLPLFPPSRSSFPPSSTLPPLHLCLLVLLLLPAISMHGRLVRAVERRIHDVEGRVQLVLRVRAARQFAIRRRCSAQLVGLF